MLFDDVTMKETIYGIIGALENESEEGERDENKSKAQCTVDGFCLQQYRDFFRRKDSEKRAALDKMWKRWLF